MRRFILTIIVILIAGKVYAVDVQRPGGRIPLDIVADEITTIYEAMMPENCHRGRITGPGPEGGSIEFNRNVCDGYFWGSTAVDSYYPDETVMLGEGEGAVEFKKYYIRYPVWENSRADFQTVLTPAEYPLIHECGTYELTDEELDRFFWGEGREGGSGGDAILQFLLPSVAWANDDSLSSEVDLVPTDPIDPGRLWTYGMLAGVVSRNLEMAIAHGEYGAENTLSFAIASRALDYFRWMSGAMSNAYPEYNVSVEPVAPIPSFFWGRESDTFGPYGLAGRYFPSQNRVILNEEYRVGGGYHDRIHMILFHEMTHAANTYSANRGFDAFTYALLNEWFAEIIENIFYWKHYPDDAPDSLERVMRTPQYQWALRSYDMLMADPYYTLYQVANYRKDIFLPNLPEEIINEAARNLLGMTMTARHAHDYYGTADVMPPLIIDGMTTPRHDLCPIPYPGDYSATIDGGSTVIECNARLYDWLLPNCWGHMSYLSADASAIFSSPAAEDLEERDAYVDDSIYYVSGCPDLDTPEALPRSERMVFNRALRRELYEESQRWDAFVVETVARVKENGGIESFLSLPAVPQLSAGAKSAIHSFLNHDNIASENRPNAPWAPNEGTVGSPPSATSRDLPQNPPNFTVEPNERGYEDPRARMPDCIAFYDEEFSRDHPASAECYQQCWDFVESLGGSAGLEERGLCRIPTLDDFWDNCEHSTSSSQPNGHPLCRDHRETRDENRRRELERERESEGEEEAESGPGRYDTPPNCRGYNPALGYETCGGCQWDDEEGYFAVNFVSCGVNQPGWESCCPACVPGYSGSAVCLSCSGGDCNPAGGGGGSSGSGGGSGSGGVGSDGGTGGSDGSDSDNNDGRGDSGESSPADPGDRRSGSGDDGGSDSGDDFIPGGRTDICEVDGICYGSCECHRDNPWLCRPTPSSSTYGSCPGDYEDYGSDTMTSGGSSSSDFECGVMPYEEWIGYGEMNCYYIGYCCDGDDCQISWWDENRDACCEDCWYRSEGFLPEAVDGCWPYAGELTCYSGMAGERCFPSGINQACGAICGCYVGDRIGYTSYENHCYNFNDGICRMHNCGWIDADTCACNFDLLDPDLLCPWETY